MNGIIEKALRILIADGNHGFSALLGAFLGCQDGFELCGIANNGLEAVKMVQKHSPDILLLDIIMPHLDGLGVLEKLAASDHTRPKVIMLTALGQETVIQRAAELGASYYVREPFDFVILADTIRHLAHELP